MFDENARALCFVCLCPAVGFLLYSVSEINPSKVVKEDKNETDDSFVVCDENPLEPCHALKKLTPLRRALGSRSAVRRAFIDDKAAESSDDSPPEVFYCRSQPKA